ncbi:MAG: BatA domain-containing protein [Planctomycetota bacterium]
MSFLTPLYLLGTLAVVAPIAFHLIRRRTNQNVPFSTLMFLEPHRPKEVRRGRLDDIPLLLLRCLVLALLAAAFARPFQRSDQWSASDVSRSTSHSDTMSPDR